MQLILCICRFRKKMFKVKSKKKQVSGTEITFRKKGGFSLIECIIALLVLLMASLAVISVFDYSFKNGESARKRFAALLLAEQRLEDVRNTSFNNLPAGTVTEQNVIYDGIPFQIVRTVTDNDILTVAAAPGPETKKITITVSPFNTSLTSETVVLTTFRGKNIPGPNRAPNNP